MRDFILGLITGLSITMGTAVWAAGVYGDGYLSGWTVTRYGEDVCYRPYVWAGSHEIECD